ncbi:MAG: glycerate kinase [Clostridia bacterium]|nr:glycerate kinase [Clostridia bacterium]
MRILIAPDSFKGSLTALEVAKAMEEGIKRFWPHCRTFTVPMADGGEGTVEALATAAGGRIIPCQVTGPLGTPVEAFFGILGDGTTAVIEMAAASGLPLVPREKLNPMATTTYGTGELMAKAMEYGCRKLVIGIGGSATNDGGMGMAQVIVADLGQDISQLPGVGAAGGLGGGLVAFTGAVLRSGVEIIMEASNLEQIMQQVDLVITGEGRTDEQTIYGKAPIGEAQRAKKYGKPVVCLSGSLGPGAEKVYEHGVDAMFSILKGPLTINQAIAGSKELITDAAERIARLIGLGMVVKGRFKEKD